MYEIKSTRLRYVTGRDAELISIYISRLKFKVEIKSVVQEKSRITVWFVIPDELKDFKNVDLG
jgi:hypothetical protein